MSASSNNTRPPSSTGLVSVIVPTYNRAYCLPLALDSALQQTHPNLEVIVIDDGSSDDTRDLIQHRYAHDPRVRYVYQENGGVAKARNHGLSLAQGDYVALLDSDDYWQPWKIELQIACLEARPEIGMVWTEMEAVDPDGERISSAYLRTMYSAYEWFTEADLFSGEDRLKELLAGEELLGEIAPVLEQLPGEGKLYTGDIYSQMIMGNLVHTSTVLIRRDRFDQVRLFNEEFSPIGEDYDFHLRTCKAGPVGYINLPAIQYQVGRSDQLTRLNLHKDNSVNCLKTIMPEIEGERERIRLPQWMIEERLAEVYAWIGESWFEFGASAKARPALWKSLAYKRRQVRLLCFLFLASLPFNSGPSLRLLFRKAKFALKGRSLKNAQVLTALHLCVALLTSLSTSSFSLAFET
jgi:glycosyltransferase involved in cell wall biosynthesis